MKYFFKTVAFAFIFLGLVCFSGCRSKKVVEENDYTVGQEDINLFIIHKHIIDEITSKYDKKLKKTQRNEHKSILEAGKEEINRYLESQGLNPDIFMRKSGKILKCYLAFRETDKRRLKKKRAEFEKQGLSDKLIEQEMTFIENTSRRLFESYTKDLTDHEIKLIQFNLERISVVVDRKPSDG